jgi:hypothetical protein
MLRLPQLKSKEILLREAQICTIPQFHAERSVVVVAAAELVYLKESPFSQGCLDLIECQKEVSQE